MNSTKTNVEGNTKLLGTIQENLTRLNSHLDELQEIEGTYYNLEDIEEIMEPVNELGKKEIKQK